MSRDFVKRKANYVHLCDASKQQKQINYFVKSSLQQDISAEYIKAWALRKYATDDYFLNYIKTIFKTANFLTFYKYLRFPSASSRLVNERIKVQLGRVFFSDDKSIKYEVDGNEIECPEIIEHSGFDSHVLDWLMFRFNDVIITDIGSDGNPFRFLVSIDKISSIEMSGNEISKIAYPAVLNTTKGYLYIDSEAYIFYPENDSTETIIPHDFKQCPAKFVSQYPFDEADNTIVRLSMFTHIRADLEEYDFLKTLQKITEPNGAFPVITRLKRNDTGKNTDTKTVSGQPDPMSAIGSQQSTDRSTVGTDEGGDMQAGTVLNIHPKAKMDGAIDTDIVKNYVYFHYIPEEPLNYIKERIKEIETSIIIDILGSYSETSETSKNELQVSLGYVSRQDKLRSLSTHISMLRTGVDKFMMSAIYGFDRSENHAFYGSDFFLETESDVYDLLKKSPNPIESRNLLDRLARSKNRYNEGEMNRDRILYRLLPYANSTDFDTAVTSLAVGKNTMQLQTRFSYWIDMFEANYGDITYFWNSSVASDSEKLILINRLLADLITKNYEEPSIAPDSGNATV